MGKGIRAAVMIWIGGFAIAISGLAIGVYQRGAFHERELDDQVNGIWIGAVVGAALGVVTLLAKRRGRGWRIAGLLCAIGCIGSVARLWFTVTNSTEAFPATLTPGLLVVGAGSIIAGMATGWLSGSAPSA